METEKLTQRVDKLDSQVVDISYDMKLLNKTMQDVAKTLEQIRIDQAKISTFETQKALLERDISDMQKKLDLVFKKTDDINIELGKILVANAGNAIRLGAGERIFWLVVAGIVGSVTWMTK
jgi:uncharacterized protein (DUF3084 family)